MLTACILFLLASFVIWFSTEIIIDAVRVASTRQHVSRFVSSLFLLGFVTTLPEIFVLVNAKLLNAPQIAVGNLIGSQFFLLFALIPLLAILTRGIHIHAEVKNLSILLMSIVVAIPILALLNQSIDIGEAIILSLVYAVFAFVSTRHAHFVSQVKNRIAHTSPASSLNQLVMCVIGLALLFLATNTAVRQLIEIAAILQTPRFLLSMLLLPISTNLAELTFAFSQSTQKKTDTALGDFIGSLACNAVLIAVLVFWQGGSVTIDQNIFSIILLFVGGMLLFAALAFSRAVLTVKEGAVVSMVYILFVLLVILLDWKQKFDWLF